MCQQSNKISKAKFYLVLVFHYLILPGVNMVDTKWLAYKSVAFSN